MDRFLWGGWVARPSASLFLRLRWFLAFCVGVVCLLLSWSALLSIVALPVLGRPFLFALLDSFTLF